MSRLIGKTSSFLQTKIKHNPFFQELLSKKKFSTSAIVTIIAILTVIGNLLASENLGQENDSSILVGLFSYDELETVKASNKNQTTKNEESALSLVSTAAAAPIYSNSEFDNSLFSSIEENTLIKTNSPTTEIADKPREDVIAYTVQNGDTISSIAQQFGISVNTILWENRLYENSLIKPGQTLNILPVAGLTHRVEKGESLESIANTYKTDINKIIAYNKLINPSDIEYAQILIVPDGVKEVPKPPVSEESRVQIASAVGNSRSSVPAIKLPDSAQTDVKGFVWPAPSRKIYQYFKWRHQGIDIDGDAGTPYYAAAAGKVVFAGWRNGYGKTVIIDHGGGLETLYAHAANIFVTQGQSVAKGQTIASCGLTGRTTGYHLHFEVHKNGSKINPLSYY